MPFKKVGKDLYKSPSGRTMTGAQVKAYYAKEGKKNAGKKTKRKVNARK